MAAFCKTTLRHLSKAKVSVLLWLLSCLGFAASAQYIVVPLCNVGASLNDTTSRAVIKLNIPANTVRILYSLSTDTAAVPVSVKLDAQATALLPDKLGWLGIAPIAGKITGAVAAGNKMHVYLFHNNKRCVDKFTLRKRNKCAARLVAENLHGGTYDAPWQGILFAQTYYLCLALADRSLPSHFRIEMAAIVAE